MFCCQVLFASCSLGRIDTLYALIYHKGLYSTMCLSWHWNSRFDYCIDEHNEHDYSFYNMHKASNGCYVSMKWNCLAFIMLLHFFSSLFTPKKRSPSVFSLNYRNGSDASTCTTDLMWFQLWVAFSAHIIFWNVFIYVVTRETAITQRICLIHNIIVDN